MNESNGRSKVVTILGLFQSPSSYWTSSKISYDFLEDGGSSLDDQLGELMAPSHFKAI